MGIFDRFTGSNESEEESSQEKTAKIDLRERFDGELVGEIVYGGEEYRNLTVESSENKEHYALYRDSTIFAISEDELIYEKSFDRVWDAAVSNDGILVLAAIAKAEDNDLGGTVYVFDIEGNEILSSEFDSNLVQVEISPDGRFAATCTFNPDRSAYIFDLEDPDSFVSHKFDYGMKQGLKFDVHDREWALYLSESSDGEEWDYAIDTEGEIVWES